MDYENVMEEALLEGQKIKATLNSCKKSNNLHEQAGMEIPLVFYKEVKGSNRSFPKFFMGRFRNVVKSNIYQLLLRNFQCMYVCMCYGSTE